MKFEDVSVYWNSKEDYEIGNVNIEEKAPINEDYKTPASIVQNFGAIKGRIT